MGNREEKTDRRCGDARKPIASRNSRPIPGLFLRVAVIRGGISSETVSLFSPDPGKFRGNERTGKIVEQKRFSRKCRVESYDGIDG